jgi:putative membrane protein insertion efficiency factor
MKAVPVQLLKGYKRWISPMLPVACRYVPTCSEYAMEAIQVHGAVRGSALAFGRLLRCHPFVRGGYDPVPHARCDHKISKAADVARPPHQRELMGTPE